MPTLEVIIWESCSSRKNIPWETRFNDGVHKMRNEERVFNLGTQISLVTLKRVFSLLGTEVCLESMPGNREMGKRPYRAS